jgi:hypothetical protein
MNKSQKIKSTILGLAFFCIGLFLANRIKFESPILDIIFAVVGLFIFVTACFFLYKSKGIFNYIFIAIIFSFISYFIIFFFMDLYPQISIILLPITLLISLIFLIMGLYKIIKNFIADFRT